MSATTPPVVPVLLCGGAGTRLWPLSRKAFPKQFAALSGTQSLFQAAAARVRGPGFAPPVVVTGADFRFIVTEQLAGAGIPEATVLIEPAPRNTAPAVLAAALHLARTDPDALLLVAPCDHLIPDAAAFCHAIDQGRAAARDGSIVTFGIVPDRPETGYGYLEPEPASAPAAPGADDAPRPLRRFIEKPPPSDATRMLAEGGYLWNAGIFLFSARAILSAFETHAPDMIAPVQAALEGMRADLTFFRLDPEPWARVAAVSIDTAVMEKADTLAVVPYGGAWSDLGGWDAVWRASQPDAAGVATHGPAQAIDCTRTLLRSESADLELVGIGLRDTLVVATPDAVLVADAARAQDVKVAVEALARKGARQAAAFVRDHRPWGEFETLALDGRFQVKRITVNPGAALSLQSHLHRAEHWVVVSGTARVQVDDAVHLLTENQSVYIPLGARHRLENPGKLPMVLIEVQTGAYLGEDDIIRYEDRYARSPEGPKG